MRKTLLIVLLLHSTIALSIELGVPEHVWMNLTSDEQIQISKKFEIKTYDASSYGILVDTQVLNKSTAGNNAGSNLGAAYAQSRYIDNAFSGNTIDYSASKQLGAGILGAVVGSLLDKPAENKFLTRYTVQLENNTIQSYDETASDLGFVLPKGICVLTNPVRNTNQNLCNMTKQDLLQITELGVFQNMPTSSRNENEIVMPIKPTKVKCKIGENAPILLDKNLCLSANGQFL